MRAEKAAMLPAPTPWAKWFWQYWPMLTMGLLTVFVYIGYGLILHTQHHQPSLSANEPWVLAISAASSPSTGQLNIIEHETFTDTDVPLDSHIYQDCTFINTCFMYDGGAYRLENATIRGVRVCVRNPRLTNYQFLLADLKSLTGGRPTRKTTIPILANPLPDEP